MSSEAEYNVEYYEHDLSDGSCVTFFSNPLNQPSTHHLPKLVDSQLNNVLLDPSQYDFLQLGTDSIDKIFLGFASLDPTSIYRVPVWLPPDILSSHVLIGGSIGSGKTSLTYRLVAGALNTFGTVVIGEAKGGVKGTSAGAAFTNLATYLASRLKVKTYRFPRGNCWFNPLLYLTTKEDRKAFMLTLSKQIKTGGGELEAYIQRAADIATLILEYIVTKNVEEEDKRKNLTLRNLVTYLKDPKSVEDELNTSISKCEELNFKNRLEKNNLLKTELQRLNFFSLKEEKGREKFVMTANGLNFLADLIDQEDLLFYTEEHDKDRNGNQLGELKMDDEKEGILYNRSLVVISQPLNHPSSKIVGPLFWDALLDHVLELGPNPTKKNGKSREKVAVFLDETHRLPTGRLGDSGDFLRQYNLALIEITPAVVDEERWGQNKHVYQTIISLSPGVSEVANLIYERLPNYLQDPIQFGIQVQTDADGSIKVIPKIHVNPIQQQIGQDNPGVSIRSLRETGKYTALLHSNLIRDALGIFWIDLESSLLAKFDNLLHDAISGNKAAIKVVDYALGLVKEYTE